MSDERLWLLDLIREAHERISDRLGFPLGWIIIAILIIARLLG